MGSDCAYSAPSNTLNQSAVIEFEAEMPRFRGQFNFAKQSAYNKIESAARQFCLTNNIDRAHIPIVSRLLAYDQHHFFAAFRSIPQELREKFTENLGNLEVELMDSLFTHLIVQQQRHLNPHHTIANVTHFDPPPRMKFAGIKPDDFRECKAHGLNLLWNMKVAVMFMVSGGEEMQEITSKALEILPLEGSPTRLQLLLTKLHQLHCKQENQVIRQPIIIACNSFNEPWLKNYLKEKRFFGFDQRMVKIAPIRNLSIINQHGKICLSFEYKTLLYPEGSAKCIELLLDHSTHLRTFLKYHQVQYLHVLGCEDELECPADPAFVGIAARLDRCMAAKCIPASELYEDKMRYVRSQSHLHLLNLKELSYLNNLELLKSAPVALNSLFFQLKWLFNLIDDYETELALARRYHPQEIYCNYYDFVAGKPVIRGKCYIFEKDVRDYIFASDKVLLVQYERSIKQTEDTSI